RAGYEISYDCPQPTPMILTLSVHPTRFPDLLTRGAPPPQKMPCKTLLHAFPRADGLGHGGQVFGGHSGDEGDGDEGDPVGCFHLWYPISVSAAVAGNAAARSALKLCSAANFL